MEAFLVSTGLVALAEIGDKTQLLALVLAAKFRRPVPIVLGILVATLANHLAAGAVGAWLTNVVSPDAMRWILGISFIAMAAWALVPDKADDAEPQRSRFGVFGTTVIAFFLLEMGDKTQIAPVALAAKYASLLAVVAGTTLGMMIANVPAVLIGEAAARKLPMRAIRMVAAALFLALGLLVLLGPRLLGEPVEEVHDARFQGILRPDHHEALVLDELLEDLRPVPQLVGGHADVGPHCVMDQHVRIAGERGVQERLDRGPHAADDGMEVARLVLRRPPELLERREDGAAARMPQHHDQPRVEALRRELHAADLRGGHDVAGDADHEQVAEPLVEHDLRGHARVRAAEDDGEGLLARRELAAAHRLRGRDVAVAHVVDEPAVAFAQAVERFECGNHERVL